VIDNNITLLSFFTNMLLLSQNSPNVHILHILKKFPGLIFVAAFIKF